MKSILFVNYWGLRVWEREDAVSIAKYEGQSWDNDYDKCGFTVTCYDNYEDGLESCGNLVYISTANSTHAKYARLSLEKGFNTIVDKPAFDIRRYDRPYRIG